MSIKIWRVEHGKSKDHKQVTDDDTEQRRRELLLLVDILPIEGGDLEMVFSSPPHLKLLRLPAPSSTSLVIEKSINDIFVFLMTWSALAQDLN